MCRVKGFIKFWDMKFSPSPAEEVRRLRKIRDAEKLRELKKKHEELKRIRRIK